MSIPVKDLMIFFCKEKPLSKARLTKMIYLADWKSALDTGEQLTDLEWIFHHYGPYLPDIFFKAQTDKDFSTYSYDHADMVAVNKDVPEPKFTPQQRKILDHVNETVKSMPFRQFLKLIYSTYPIRTQEKYSTLDLPALALVYRREKATAAAVAGAVS